MTASIEDFKPEIENHLRYLQAAAKRKLFSRKKPESKQTGKVIDRLYECVYKVDTSTTSGVDIDYLNAMAKYIVEERLLIPTVLKMWKYLVRYAHEKRWTSQGYRNLRRLIHLCWNLSYYCREFGDELVANGAAPMLLTAIIDDDGDADDDDDDDNDNDDDDDDDDNDDDDDDADDDDDGDAGDDAGDNDDDDDDDDDDDHDRFNHNYSLLCILQNSIRQSVSKNRSVYRAADAIPILKRLLKYNNKIIRMMALMILSYVVNEDQREILSSSKIGIGLLLMFHRLAVKGKNHYFLEFSAFLTLVAINHLAINDANKRVIGKTEGSIPAIIRMLEDDFSDEERKVAANALWNLSFIESIRESELVQSTIPSK